MANWAKLQENLTGLPVVKRAKHSIHFDKGNGEIVANFSGAPCHYEEKGVWKPIDTTLLLGADGFYGCPHSPVKVHKDGRVKVDKSDYSQFTELPGSPIGRVDGDRIVRDFPGGYQELFVTEDGFREVITVIKPTFPLEKFIGKQTGTLPSVYKASPQTAVVANGDVFEITSDTKAFGNWLNKAVYPVTIDPDFAGGTADARVASSNANYATMINGHNNESDGTLYCGQLFLSNIYYGNCTMVLFDTSDIDDDATITQVNLKMVVTADSSTTDFDVGIKKYDWHLGTNGEKWHGVIAADYDDAIWRNTNGMSVNTQYASGNLSTAWVSKTGTTYYVLCSTKLGVTPPTGAEYIQFADSSHATEAYRPVLTVTYTTGSTGVPKHFLHYARLRSN